MVIGTRVEYLSVENWDVFRERKIPQNLLIDWIFAKSCPKEILVLIFHGKLSFFNLFPYVISFKHYRVAKGFQARYVEQRNSF